MWLSNGIIFSLFLSLVICEELQNAINWYNEKISECESALKNLTDIETLEGILNDVYYIDDPDGINLAGTLTFDNLIVTKLVAPDVKDQSGNSYTHKFDKKFDIVGRNLMKVENDLKDMDKLIGIALKTNGSQKVSGNIKFTNAYFDCGDADCNIKSIETKTLNRRKIEQLSSRVIRLNEDQILDDHFNFSNMVVNDINVNFINNIAPSDIITKNGNHFIPGDVIFESFVRVDQLNVTKTVNDFKIDRETVLTKNDQQVITAPVSFTHGITVKDLNVDKLAHIGSNVNSYLRDIVQTDREGTISGKKRFKELVVDDLVVEGDQINGFNFTDLRNLLKRDDSQTINALVSVDELVVEGDMNVDTINGNVFEEMVVRRNVPTVIRGEKTFTGPVYIKSMQVSGKLNNRLIRDSSLGLMLKKGPQVITGSKEFIEIQARNLTLLHGNVGPLKLELLENKLNSIIQGGKNRVLSGPIQLVDIEVEGKVNGIDLNSLMRDYLMVNQTAIPNVNLNIAKANFIKPLICKRINGLKFPDDFITKNSDQFINGNIDISSKILVNSDLNLTYINSYQVNAVLLDSLKSTSNQVIQAPKTINGNLFVKNLTINSLNNIKMSDLILLNGNTKVLGNKTFSAIKVVGSSSIGSINGVKTINKIHINELFNNSISKRGHQIVSSNVHVKKLVIPLGSNVNVTELAGIKLDHLLSSVVLLKSNETQIIKGKKRFTSQATFGNLQFDSTFAGYSKDDFSNNYLSRNSSEINADITIDSDLFIDNDLIVTGSINELNVSSLSRHLPVNSKPIFINRPMSFRHVRIIGGNLAAETINGLKFGEVMVTKKSSITFTGDAKFAHGITVNHLSVRSINNVTIDKSVCDPIQKLFYEPAFSLTVNGNVSVEANLTVKSINGQSFKADASNIKGAKRFTRLNVKGPIHLKGLLNNHDVKYIANNYLSRTKDQTIDSEVILRSASFFGKVYIDGNLFGRNITINNRDIKHVNEKMLRKNGNQNIDGTFYFSGPVIFRKGLINSPFINLNGTMVNLSQDVFLKNRPNRVNVNLTFKSAHIDYLETNEKSNFHRSVSDYDQITHFYGSKNFQALEIDDLVVDFINNHPVESFLRNDHDGNLPGTLALDGNLVIKPNLTVSGSVNGIKLQQLALKLVLNGQNNTIDAPLNLLLKPIVRSLEVPGPWNRRVSEYLHELAIPKKMESLKRKIHFNSKKLNAINQYLKSMKNSSMNARNI